MTVLVWVTEESWMACVDAALVRAPADEVALLHVTDAGAVDAAQGAFSALLGRGGAGPAQHLEAMAEAAATEVLEAAAARLARPAQQLRRRGRPEREVVAAAQDAALLVLGRQGAEAGPRSLGKAARFVVDHAPCPVLLVWPGPAPQHPLPPPPHDPPPGRTSGPGRPPGRPGGPGQRLE
jgi:nucleotide-binding universal stress UspA family protein